MATMDGRRLNWIQACELLGCKKTHFYWLINSGRLPAYRHGLTRGVWVYEKDCREWLKSTERREFSFAISASSSTK